MPKNKKISLFQYYEKTEFIQYNSGKKIRIIFFIVIHSYQAIANIIEFLREQRLILKNKTNICINPNQSSITMIIKIENEQKELFNKIKNILLKFLINEERNETISIIRDITKINNLIFFIPQSFQIDFKKLYVIPHFKNLTIKSIDNMKNQCFLYTFKLRNKSLRNRIFWEKNKDILLDSLYNLFNFIKSIGENFYFIFSSEDLTNFEYIFICSLQDKTSYIKIKNFCDISLITPLIKKSIFSILPLRINEFSALITLDGKLNSKKDTISYTIFDEIAQRFVQFDEQHVKTPLNPTTSENYEIKSFDESTSLTMQEIENDKFTAEELPLEMEQTNIFQDISQDSIKEQSDKINNQDNELNIMEDSNFKEDMGNSEMELMPDLNEDPAPLDNLNIDNRETSNTHWNLYGEDDTGDSSEKTEQPIAIPNTLKVPTAPPQPRDSYRKKKPFHFLIENFEKKWNLIHLEENIYSPSDENTFYFLFQEKLDTDKIYNFLKKYYKISNKLFIIFYNINDKINLEKYTKITDLKKVFLFEIYELNNIRIFQLNDEKIMNK